ncbi:MAG TPA: hypothetical protein VGO00_28865 [Kofleriaceae bacterium]|nr:hypothetical protein [Kofleriaceae bacterium]
MTAWTRCAFIAAIAACGEPSAPTPGVRAVSSAMIAPGRIELGTMMALRYWSADGRYAVFEAQPPYSEHWARQSVNIVVDTTTLTSFEIDRANLFEFAPDGQHLAVTVRGQLVVYDLATGQPIGKPSPVYNGIGFAPDRRLAWVVLNANELQIHLRDLATGSEQVLVGLPASTLSRYNDQIHEQVRLVYDPRGHVLATTPEALRVWANDAPQPIVAVNSTRLVNPQLTDDGLAYTREVDGHGVFEHIDLVEHRTPTELHPRRTCDAGETVDGSRAERCETNRYVVRGVHGLCVWDTQAGTVLASIRDDDDDDTDTSYACRGDVVRLGHRYYSALTGKKIREPHDFADRPAPTVVQTGLPVRSDKLPNDATDTRLSPNQTMIAGVWNNRGTLWTSSGRLVWQTPRASEVQQIALSENGELVALGHEGQIWHFDLATHKLRTGKLNDCEISDDTPITTTADGHVVATCLYANRRRLVLEGADKPLVIGGDRGWSASASTSASATTAAWISSGFAHVYSLPDGVEQWSFPVPPHGFAVTSDRQRFATVEELGINSRKYLLTIRDSTNHALAIAALPVAPNALMFSTDGAYLAAEQTAPDVTTVTIYDAKLGNVVDTFRSSSDAIAWDPSGAPRIASWLPDNAGLAIRDVSKHRDDEIRLTFVDGPVHVMAWSEDGIAVVADQRIVVWTRSRATLALAGTGGIELRSNTTATLLGEPTSARAMFGCRIGTQTSPTMWCDDKLVDP